MKDKTGRIMFGFQKLDVWQMARKLVSDVYRMTRQFPEEEKYGLTSQINRAVISVASNIAEGSGRTSYKDQARFTETAYGSLMELACELMVSEELGFVDRERLEQTFETIVPISEKLSALRKSQLSRSAVQRARRS